MQVLEAAKLWLEYHKSHSNYDIRIFQLPSDILGR